jgi:hypothetical protein
MRDIENNFGGLALQNFSPVDPFGRRPYRPPANQIASLPTNKILLQGDVACGIYVRMLNEVQMIAMLSPCRNAPLMLFGIHFDIYIQ